MKLIRKLILIIIIIYPIIDILGQNNGLQTITIHDTIIPFIIPNTLIKQSIENVLPGVNFIYAIDLDIMPPGGGLFCTFKDRSYMVDRINRLLLDIKYLVDSTRTFSDEDLIKTFMFLSISPSINFLELNPKPINFEIEQVDSLYKGKVNDYYQRIGFDDYLLNYKAKASWFDDDQECIKEFIYFFNITNSEIISIVRQRIIFEVPRDYYFEALEYSEVFEKFKPTGRYFYIENLKKEKVKIDNSKK